MSQKKVTTAPSINKKHEVNKIKCKFDKREWTVQTCSPIIWFDEKKFSPDGPDGLAFYQKDNCVSSRLLSKSQSGG